jgi:hypothetical protein
VSVERMGLITCIFKKDDGIRIWYPIAKLIATPILNVSRSRSKSDCFTVSLDIGTPNSTFVALQEACLRYMAKHPKDFTQRCECLIIGTQEPMKFVLSIGWESAFSPADASRFARVRHGLYMCISDNLAAMDVNYTSPPVPVPMPVLPKKNATDRPDLEDT